MRLSRTALLLASALAAGARATAAQTIPSPYEYIEATQSPGAFAGFIIADPDISISDSVSVPMGPRSGPVFGVRYQIRAAGPLSIEGGLGLLLTDRRLFDAEFDAETDVVTTTDLGTTVPATVGMADVALRFHLTGPRTWNGLAPFVAGTGGFVGDLRGTFAEEEVAVDSTEFFRFGPSFAVGAGLGTDWFPARNVSLRVEASGRLWRMRTPSGFLPNPDAERREWNPAVGVTVGGAIHF
ncbi:MAG TPA: hypothetical protein VHG08_15785 [Longimicrobium sp.]|nr:hypothetical protein [Longimicrobium sp.]